MPLPTAYTEATLATYMRTGVLRETAATLGWVDDAPLAEAVNDALLLYGVGDIAAATDMRRLRYAAQVAAWQAVIGATVGDYDIEALGAKVTRSGINAQARARLAAVKDEAAGAGIVFEGAPRPELPTSAAIAVRGVY